MRKNYTESYPQAKPMTIVKDDAKMHTAPAILILERPHKHILQITLNRPEALNALNADLLGELDATFLQVKADKSVKGILLTGMGKAFCAGADIKQFPHLTSQTGYEFAVHGQKVMRALEQCGKPSLAAVNGFALGGGCELAMATTLRMAATTAIFGQPEIKLGLIPGFGGTQRLSRLIGKGRALDMCLSGRIIKADEALLTGLVSRVVAPAELLKEAVQMLTEIINLAPLALQSIMTVIDDGFNISLTEALELEAAHFGLCCGTADKEEGVKAFIEKRAAVFNGN
jgi:enoyl-CoA hydratase